MEYGSSTVIEREYRALSALAEDTNKQLQCSAHHTSTALDISMIAQVRRVDGSLPEIESDALAPEKLKRHVDMICIISYCPTTPLTTTDTMSLTHFRAK